MIKKIEMLAEWQNGTTILGMFTKNRIIIPSQIQPVCGKGIETGRRTGLAGSGLIRSVGG